MKSLFISTALLCAFFLAKAQPPKGPAPVGTVYGAEPKAADPQPIAVLPELLNQKDTVFTTVSATVLDVCSKKGCWVKLQVNDSTEAFVKMKGYAFFVPLDLIGKTVVLEGSAYTVTTSVAELRHYAEDAKKSKAEIEAITQPKKEIKLLASGIKVVK